MTTSRPKTGISAAANVVAIVCLLAAGCASVPPPPSASFTQTATFDRPPKPDDCFMPLLQREPLTTTGGSLSLKLGERLVRRTRWWHR